MDTKLLTYVEPKPDTNNLHIPIPFFWSRDSVRTSFRDIGSLVYETDEVYFSYTKNGKETVHILQYPDIRDLIIN
jgi:hypothetical protein